MSRLQDEFSCATIDQVVARLVETAQKEGITIFKLVLLY